MRLFILSLLLAVAAIAQPSDTIKVDVTHRDGTVHTFLIPRDVEASYDLLRSARIKRASPDPQTPQVPGAIISEERNFGELLQATVLESYERLVTQKQFQPPTLQTEVDTIEAALIAKIKANRDAAKAAMRPASPNVKAEPARDDSAQPASAVLAKPSNKP